MTFNDLPLQENSNAIKNQSVGNYNKGVDAVANIKAENIWGTSLGGITCKLKRLPNIKYPSITSTQPQVWIN